MAKWLTSRVVIGTIEIADPTFAAEQFFALCQTQDVTRRKLRLVDDLPKPAMDRIVAGAVYTFLTAYGRRLASA